MAADRSPRAAIFLEVVAILSIIGGMILGVVVAAQTSTTDSFYSSTTHPYVGVGVAIAVGAFVGGMFYWSIARVLRLFAEHVAITHDVDIDSGLPILEEEEDDDDYDGDEMTTQRRE